jgi:nicotinate-nucleotide adenylyltransferase
MRTLILGGTFNPVHTGHVRLAVEASERLGCTRLIWLPSYSPHYRSRAHLLAFDLRVGLITAASAAFKDVVVSDIERRATQSRYSFDILSDLCAEERIESPYFAMGPELFQKLPSWYRGTELPRRIDIAVGAREDFVEDDFHGIVSRHWPDFVRVEAAAECLATYRDPSDAHGMSLLAMPRLDINATMIRRLWREGRSIAQLVPDAVLDVLMRHREQVDAAWELETDCQTNKQGHISL